jgi:hypothetical protein
MWGWTLLGVSLMVPAINDDPKPWPDLLWPATLSGTLDERVGIAVLAAGMITSGLLFIVGQSFLPRVWAEKARWLGLWFSTVTVVYIIASLTVKGLRDPDQMAWYWPVSALAWLVSACLMGLAIRAAARHGYGSIHRGLDRRVAGDGH